jgi:peptide/nickel transport system ATP-binding protein
MSALIEAHGLGVRYDGTPALQGIDLSLAPGERLAVIGESGSGKSSLALALCGLLPRNARRDGTLVFPAFGATPRLGRDIGVLFQDPGGSLNPVLPIGEQIAEAAVIHRGLTWAAAWAQGAAMLARLGLEGAPLDRFAHEFSGGQRQRIALAAALSGQPRLLIADEPTSALDTLAQHEMVGLIDGIVRADGLGLVFVTHDIALAGELADRVLVLHAGRAVETGPVAQVFAAPAHAYTRALLATHLDLARPRTTRLPEIVGADFEVRIPHG